MKMSKKSLIVFSMLFVLCVGCFSGMGLSTMLGISSAAAVKVINIIDAVSTVATIISLVAAIVGAGAISAAIVAAAKKMIKKYGKAYAAAW